MCLNNHKTPEIAEKVYELINLVKQRVLLEIFEFKNFNQKNEKKKAEEMNPLINNNNINTLKFKQKTIKSRESIYNGNQNKNMENLNENNIENFKKILLREIFDSKNKKILEQKSSKNGNIRNNNISANNREFNRDRESREKSSYSRKNKLENLSINRYKGNYGNNSSLFNKYNILMSKKIIEEKKAKLNRDSNDLNAFEENQYESYNVDSSYISLKENTSNLTNISGYNNYKMRNSKRENLEKKRKENILQRKSKQNY